MSDPEGLLDTTTLLLLPSVAQPFNLPLTLKHLDNPELSENSMADAERWASGMTGAGHAIDDQTAITVVDGTVEVVSEGHWRLFAPLRLRDPCDPGTRD